MKNTLILLLILLSSCLNTLLAQELEYFGAPFIKQYLPKDYDGSAQNWDMVQDKRGIFYIGSTDGLLEFDGANWRKYKLSNKSIVVRSLAIGSNGAIWVGSQDEFGYFAPDSLGDLHYTSLSVQLPDSLQNFADIWQTIATSSGVYFFTSSKIYRWYKEKLSIIPTKLPTIVVEKLFDKIYLFHSDKGLASLSDTTITQLLNDEDINKFGNGYRSICEYKDNKILIATLNNGFFIYDIESKKLSQPKIDPKITQFLSQNTGAYALSKINDNAYAVGTFKAGLLVLNADLKLTDVVNTNRGIQNNSIYALFTDRDNALWAMLQNGLARIAINNPLRAFGEKQNMNAFGLDAVTFENKKYVATMNGCFVLEKHSLSIENDNHKFTYIPNLDNCWDLLLYQDKLLASGFFGVSQIVDNKAKVLFNKNGDNAFKMISSKKFPNHLFIGYKDNFAVIELVKQNNSKYLKVKNSFFFPNIVGEVRAITEDENGDLYLGMGAGGTVYIRLLNNNDPSIHKMTFFNAKNGLPSNTTVVTVNVNNQVNFLTAEGIYRQIKNENSQESDSLIQFEYNKFWGDYISQHNTYFQNLAKVEGNLFVLASDDISAFLEKKQDTIIVNEAPFLNILGLSDLIPEQNYINGCTSSSFYIYDLNKDSIRTDKVYNALIRKVEIAQDSLIFKGSFYTKNGSEFEFAQTQGQVQTPILDYDNNSMKIHFSASFYDSPEEIKYAYLLEGFNQKWSKWSKESHAVFTNIPEGKYTFQVKAKNIYRIESTMATYQFTILPPWYRTIFAFIFYFLLLVGFIWAIVKLNSRRLVKEKEKLEDTVIERTAELFQQKEEILVQAESLLQANDKLESAYTNVQLLSDIGQKITSKLSVENIIETVYQQVNLLMNAEVFAIGVVSFDGKKLDFYGTKESEETLPYCFDKLDNKNKLSVYCYNNFAKILIKDFDSEITNYLPIRPTSTTAGSVTKSLIYLPLGTKEKKVGVITVQSFEQNAYTAYHLNMLKNIGIYTSIALENSDVYSQVKHQHSQIKSSVNYARTIQNAILPSKTQLAKLFDNFIIYRPKDIVSGDFYWLSEVENVIFVAVVDCTGHGVPGAFMSMIGSRLLSEIVNERKILETNLILEALNTGIRKVLHQEQTDNTDGMDICLCKIKKNDLGADIYFTGAKTPLFVYQNDKAELLRIRGDKKAIGGHHFQDLSFTQTKLSLQKGDTIYLSSDGFVDQNNHERKKYSTTKLITLFKKMHNKSLPEQKEALENELDNWQGEGKQRDDITIMGIRI